MVLLASVCISQGSVQFIVQVPQRKCCKFHEALLALGCICKRWMHMGINMCQSLCMHYSTYGKHGGAVFYMNILYIKWFMTTNNYGIPWWDLISRLTRDSCFQNGKLRDFILVASQSEPTKTDLWSAKVTSFPVHNYIHSREYLVNCWNQMLLSPVSVPVKVFKMESHQLGKSSV